MLEVVPIMMVVLMIVVVVMRMEEVMVILMIVNADGRGDEDWGGDAGSDHGDNNDKNNILECSLSVGQYFKIVYIHLFKSYSNKE